MFNLKLFFFHREPPVLQAHNRTDIILRLPMGKRIRDIRWLSVWCRRFTVSSSRILFVFLRSRTRNYVMKSTLSEFSPMTNKSNRRNTKHGQSDKEALIDRFYTHRIK